MITVTLRRHLPKKPFQAAYKSRISSRVVLFRVDVKIDMNDGPINKREPKVIVKKLNAFLSLFLIYT